MNRKLLLCIFLSLLICCCALFAACFLSPDDKDDKDNKDELKSDFTFELREDGQGLTVTGYDGSDTDVTVPAEYNGSPVTTVGGTLFRGNGDIVKVTLPDSITVIENDAFANTAALREVVFPKNLVEIGPSAFYKSDITNVSLPNTVQTVGANAFYGAENLETFKLAEGSPITALDVHTFEGCSKLSVVRLSEKIKTLDQYCFNGCANLETIDLKHVETVAERCFENCVKLSDVDFGDSVKKIAGEAFKGTAIKTVELPDTELEIAPYAFDGCKDITSIVLPEKTVIVGGPFSGCSKVQSLTVPSGQSTLPNLFNLGFKDDYSESLSEFTTLNVVGQARLADGFGSKFSKLKNITVDERISKAGYGCFAGTAWYDSLPDGNVYIGKLLLGYKGAKPAGELTVQEGTLGIADKAFSDCDGLTKISFPNSVKTVGSEAFANCGLNGSVTFSSDLEFIGKKAFLNCALINGAIFGNSLTEIGESAFEGCDISGRISLPETAAILGANCFKGNKNAEEIVLSFGTENTLAKIFYSIPTTLNKVEALGSVLPENALKYASNVTEVSLSEKITVIPDYAFYGCSKLTVNAQTMFVDCGQITEIGKYAFTDCDSITALVVPDSVTLIDYGAFCNMNGLTTVSLGANVESVGDRVFSVCGKLKKIVLNEKLEKIGAFAFNSCQSLSEINFPASLKILGDNAFFSCACLTNVELNEGLESIGDEAFCETKLQNLMIPLSVSYVGRQVVKDPKTENLAAFKLFVKAEQPNEYWDKRWNLNRADYDKGELIEGTENYFPTYYYSETEKTDDELQFWHYEEGVPTPWE